MTLFAGHEGLDREELFVARSLLSQGLVEDVFSFEARA